MFETKLSFLIVRKKKGRDFVGLILAAWIGAATLGSLNASLEESGVVVVVIFVVVVALTLKAFVVVLREERVRESIHTTYIQTFLYTTEEEKQKLHADTQGQWSVKFLGIIFIMSVVCSIPWLIFNISGFHQKTISMFEHSVSLCVYSISFYTPSLICIYMKYRDLKISRTNGSTPSASLEGAYRLRYYSRQHSLNMIIIEDGIVKEVTTAAAAPDGTSVVVTSVNQCYTDDHLQLPERQVES